MQGKNGVFNGTWPMMAQEPDPQVNPKAERRQFSVEYKLSVLAEADQCSKPGQIGALLRREGLYASHLSKWREQREAGGLGQQRGRKPNPQTGEYKRLQRENERLRSRLVRAEYIIDVQKKLAHLLGTSLDETLSDER